MSTVTRARTVVQGDITVQQGDVVIEEAGKGIVMTDNVGEASTVKVVDDGGVKTLVIEVVE